MLSKQLWRVSGNSLVWQPEAAHSDDIEMSGLYVDVIVDYGVDEAGALRLQRHAYFPTLRTIPNDTHATYSVTLPQEAAPRLLCDGSPVTEYPQTFTLDGLLTVCSRTNAGVQVTRCLFPASAARCALEQVTVTASQTVTLSVSLPAETVVDRRFGTKGVYVAKLRHTAPPSFTLQAGESLTYTVALSADPANSPALLPDAETERESRLRRIAALCDRSLVLDTGIPELDVMIRFAKLRAGESIFETLSGKFHSPGGRAYYAAIWCNDQIEYAGPHFAMTGDPVAIEASLNAYRAYIPFMSDDYHPLPCSIIAEGLDIWNGADDRGDAAMYLYGASLFCLYLGDRAVAEELYPAIRWCAEYCDRRRLPEGVIGSDTDELEGRFPTDRIANLSTSALCYGGLLTAAQLAESLGNPATAALYRQRAAALEQAIETYFGANLHGFDTYRYSRGIETLRAWICLPLCVGITTRLQGTMDAMLSPYLWTEEGMLTCELSEENRNDTIWDRSTLYGFKCAFMNGQGDRVIQPLLRYCRKRLLCDRVPYAVEAYPEGGKRHLSGESALLVRVITEGLLGIRPVGLNAFSFVPQLPAGLPHIRLSCLYMAGHCWDICVESEGWTVTVDGKTVATGKTDGDRVTVYV